MTIATSTEPTENGRNVLADYQEWREERADLSAAEDDGGADWSASDDAGCDLAARLAAVLTDVLNAADRAASVLGDPMTASDVASHFTCSEADAVATLLVVTRNLPAAAYFLAGHADGDDDEDDSHADLIVRDDHGSIDVNRPAVDAYLSDLAASA